MARYAGATSVAPSQSRAEIERTLERYEATSFAYGQTQDRVVLGFEMRGRRVKFVLDLPAPNDFRHTPTGKWRTDSSQADAHQQAIRQRWRALALVIKAKLEAVAAGIVTFEEEFMAQTVLPDGRTVAEHVGQSIEIAYQDGQVPLLLADMTERSSR